MVCILHNVLYIYKYLYAHTLIYIYISMCVCASNAVNNKPPKPNEAANEILCHIAIDPSSLE